MNLMSKLFNSIMYEVEGGGGAGVQDAPVGKVDTLSLVDDLDFKKDESELELKDEKKPDGDDKDDESNKDDEDEKDELQELEDELKEPKEEDLELGVPSTRRQILKDFPDIFKKHPSLEKSFYRDQEFTKLFEHPKEAVEAKELLDTYAAFEADVSKGDLTKIVTELKSNDTEAFNTLVDNFLPMLEKTDRTAWLNVVENVSKQVLAHAFQMGKSGNDDELQAATRIVYKALMGTEEYTPPTKLSKGTKTEDTKSDRELELEKREKEYNERTSGAARESVDGDVDRVIRATITKHIDPRESMSEYVRKNAIRDAVEMYQNQVKNDSSFQKLLERFWDAAKKSNYNKTSLDRIVEANKNKASSLLGAIIRKVKNDASKSSSQRSKNDDDDTSKNEDRPRRVVARPRNETGPSNGNEDRGKRVIPKGMTTAEWLAQK